MVRNAKGSPENPEGDNRGKKNRRGVRRFALVPLSFLSAFICPIEERLVYKVIELAEAAAKAEAARRSGGKLLSNAALLPSFGDDIAHLLPSAEHRRLVTFLAAQLDDLLAKLIVLMWIGRENDDPNPEVIEHLLERAHEMREHAGSYLAGKSRLALYLRRGLAKLHDAESRRA